MSNRSVGADPQTLLQRANVCPARGGWRALSRLLPLVPMEKLSSVSWPRPSSDSAGTRVSQVFAHSSTAPQGPLLELTLPPPPGQYRTQGANKGVHGKSFITWQQRAAPIRSWASAPHSTFHPCPSRLSLSLTRWWLSLFTHGLLALGQLSPSQGLKVLAIHCPFSQAVLLHGWSFQWNLLSCPDGEQGWGVGYQEQRSSYMQTTAAFSMENLLPASRTSQGEWGILSCSNGNTTAAPGRLSAPGMGTCHTPAPVKGDGSNRLVKGHKPFPAGRREVEAEAVMERVSMTQAWPGAGS